MTTDLKTSTAAGLSPRVLQFQRGNPWYATDEEVDRLRQEYLNHVHSGTDPTVHFSGIADDAEADAGQTAYLPDASTKVF